MSFRINYDDDSTDAIAKVQAELAQIGIHVTIEDDGQPHDGYMLFDVKTDNKPLPVPPHTCFNCRHHLKKGCLSCAYCNHGSNWQGEK